MPCGFDAIKEQLDAGNRRFIDELLGEGEVSMICSGRQNLHIQESVLAGVWRLQKWNAGTGKQIEHDALEITFNKVLSGLPVLNAALSVRRSISFVLAKTGWGC
ncbi:MAG: hydrogenase expression/formation C-terminal domain-containing protein [Gammaproteobacteria bacterium]